MAKWFDPPATKVCHVGPNVQPLLSRERRLLYMVKIYDPFYTNIGRVARTISHLVYKGGASPC